MSRADRKAWRENKRANHRRNEMRRWHRKCAKAFAPMRMLSGFVRQAWPHIKDPKPYSHNWHIEVLCQEYDVLNQVLLSSRRQAVNGCMPKQMMTGSESGESYAQAVVSGASPRFLMIDDPINEPYSPEAVARAVKWSEATIEKRSNQ